ncbi:hypothetical protein M9H77_33907 [Catharanthus roseus]|uniref:Uncharacterized protein n=1 Tax=Catharanthus roseus TaxID=4058 RepID=A0ACB9ZJR4_CATRO|nr:hypothetical protein M9H77_33907 [Catharanthus roseus]
MRSMMMKSFAVILFIFAIGLSPLIVSSSSASRVGRELLQRMPPCPRCLCCAPPPRPGTCCPCFCPVVGGPIQPQQPTP